MMVFIQQGTQIAQIYAGQGGVNAALRQTADLGRARSPASAARDAASSASPARIRC